MSQHVTEQLKKGYRKVSCLIAQSLINEIQGE